MYRSGSSVCAYRRNGATVTVVCDTLKVQANKELKIATMPEGLRPSIHSVGFGYQKGVSSIGQLAVSASGTVAAWCNTGGAYFSGSVTYPLP